MDQRRELLGLRLPRQERDASAIADAESGLDIFLIAKLDATSTQKRGQPLQVLAGVTGHLVHLRQVYAVRLRALQEPSLFVLAANREAEAYRFLWLRSFHHPIAVRVDLQADGSWVLVTKVASGAGGYSPGTLTTNISRQLTTQEAQSFRSEVEGGGFWNAPNPVNDQTGTDGSDWIIEGVKAGRYHVIDRWSPTNGLPTTWDCFSPLTWQG